MNKNRLLFVEVAILSLLACWIASSSSAPAPNAEVVASNKETLEDLESNPRFRRDAKSISLSELKSGEVKEENPLEKRKKRSDLSRQHHVRDRSKRQAFYPEEYALPIDYDDAQNSLDSLSDEDLLRLALLIQDELREMRLQQPYELSDQEVEGYPEEIMEQPYYEDDGDAYLAAAMQLAEEQEAAEARAEAEREAILSQFAPAYPVYVDDGYERQRRTGPIIPEEEEEYQPYPIWNGSPSDQDLLDQLELEQRIAELAAELNDRFYKKK